MKTNHGDTKICKHCKTEIDYYAKRCPQCRKSQGGKGKFIALGVVVFIILIAALNGGDDDEPKLADNSTEAISENANTEDVSVAIDNNEDTQATEDVEKTTFNVGETVTQKDILVTLNSINESEGSEYNKPAEGNVFLLCEFNIENNSDKDIAVSSMISFEAYCDSYAVNQSLTGLIEKGDKQQLDGSVAAGKKMNGVIAYEVSSDWKELEISFTPDFWSSKDIVFIATK